ncbi:MAG: imidazole glycerol phosphate synthase subunit HisH [Elusimicrobia bacterium]|nr:imidazole glycerol phosphate synthase subunit HisH [Elusimicrobiota bacterium]
MRVAIIDYGMGNLFSVQRACEQVGLDSVLATSPETVLAADGVILPGVGAFGDAMEALRQSGLADALCRVTQEDKPILGICLGMQLLMEESFEFGRHPGLGILKGSVIPLQESASSAGHFKVPHVGWSQIWRRSKPTAAVDTWKETPLQNLEDGAYMYFVHSFTVVPESDCSLSTTRYGQNEFCSSLARGNIFACQFHPERSGPQGLRIYQAWAAQLKKSGALL